MTQEDLTKELNRLEDDVRELRKQNDKLWKMVEDLIFSLEYGELRDRIARQATNISSSMIMRDKAGY